MRRILWVNPVGTPAYDRPIADILARVRRPDTAVEVVSVDVGAPVTHVEYRAYEALAYPHLVRIAHEAAGRGFDAIVVGCFYDTALKAVREVSGGLPVVGPCQTAVQLATTLADRFSILATRVKCASHMRDVVRSYGADHALASIRALGIGVAELQADPGITARRILEEGRRAVEEDGAEVIVLGCTVEFGFHEEAQATLGVPVIDAVCAPFKQAEHLADLAAGFGWRPSRIGEGEPPPPAEAAAFGIALAGAVPVLNRLEV